MLSQKVRGTKTKKKFVEGPKLKNEKTKNLEKIKKIPYLLPSIYSSWSLTPPTSSSSSNH